MGSKSTYNKYGRCEHYIEEIKDTDAVFNALLKKWTKKAEETDPSYWPVKYVSIIFVYKGLVFGLFPKDINTNENVFESLSNEIEDDLLAIDCEDIFYTGMLD